MGWCGVGAPQTQRLRLAVRGGVATVRKPVQEARKKSILIQCSGFCELVKIWSLASLYSSIYLSHAILEHGCKGSVRTFQGMP
ncbi:MAG: hypothetical protein A3G60_00740 [Candidatus Ryanbacteria bacterium RIFCSPLOWO2_12_FULL_47_9c]|uniref:Uncharacterized protein n=2 Tax=Candidatus Ryaniibacteriota TaxID=1817914 RepID=A0A1G2H6U6_9BACT|nr:MAG: hypothetical protein A3J04_00995 [Candidatus Ryanbacteria bacterium RIFCSPLOWO2_02_FULL_47_14]OGZ57668.1 MAG: hypothetical protein A3G60_00740 [Candidatus Ryanbacteria bacterium RIFCSPLOWO2_12_FULL_47_9c]